MFEGFSGKIVIRGFEPTSTQFSHSHFATDRFVAGALIDLLLRHCSVKPEQLVLLESELEISYLERFRAKGTELVCDRIDENNVALLLDRVLSPGDVFLNLQTDISTLDLVKYAEEKKVNLLCPCVYCPDFSEWGDAVSTCFDREHKFLLANSPKLKNSKAVLAYGEYSSLISLFVKKALLDIADTFSKKENLQLELRESIEKAASDSDFSALAKLLDLRGIQLSEFDSQLMSEETSEDHFLSTRSAGELCDQVLSGAQFVLGSNEETKPKWIGFSSKANYGYGVLPVLGSELWSNAWVPSGAYRGMLVAAEEVLCVKRLLENNRYSPSIFYVYRPSQSCLQSLEELKEDSYRGAPRYIILADELDSGSLELGALLYGRTFGAHWAGVSTSLAQVRSMVSGSNATAFLRAVSTIVSLSFLLKQNSPGIYLPEQMDAQEYISLVEKFLGEIVSARVKWYPGDREGGYKFRDFVCTELCWEE